MRRIAFLVRAIQTLSIFVGVVLIVYYESWPAELVGVCLVVFGAGLRVE